MKAFTFLAIVLAFTVSSSNAGFFKGISDQFFNHMDDMDKKIHDAIDKMSQRLNLNQTIFEHFEDIREKMHEFTQNMTRIEECHEPHMNGTNLNIFNSSHNLNSILKFYYTSFRNKTANEDSIKNLINSVRDIIDRCLNHQNFGAKFGFTELSDLSDDEINRMNGVLPTSQFNNTEARFERAASGRDSVCIRDGSLPSSFDWRQHNAVTPVKNQGQCGSCWTFATTASMESAYLIKKKATSTSFDLSEQQLVDCARPNGCQGGFAVSSFEYILKNGQTSEANSPYRANDNRCPGSKTAAAQIANYCVRSRNYYGSSLQPEQLSDTDIQKALVFFGPLYITLNASPLNTRNYRSGVFDYSGCGTQINHAVTLVGYTPDAWIIKNSWGPYWGESGYLRLARGKNMCGVNTEIAYPILN